MGLNDDREVFLKLLLTALLLAVWGAEVDDCRVNRCYNA
jgi:hypothetical protein